MYWRNLSNLGLFFAGSWACRFTWLFTALARFSRSDERSLEYLSKAEKHLLHILSLLTSFDNRESTQSCSSSTSHCSVSKLALQASTTLSPSTEPCSALLLSAWLFTFSPHPKQKRSRGASWSSNLLELAIFT